MEGLLRVYDGRGRFLRTVGNRGSGPGEFRTITSIGLQGDTIWASDITQSRVNFFTPDGRPVRTATIQGKVLEGTGRPLAARAVLASNRFLAIGLRDSGEFFSGGAAEELIVEIDGDGVLAGEFGRFAISGAVRSVRTNNRRLSFLQPLRSTGIVATSSNGGFLALIHPPVSELDERLSLALTLMRSPEDTVYTRRIRVAPVPIASATQDSIREALVRDWTTL